MMLHLLQSLSIDNAQLLEQTLGSDSDINSSFSKFLSSIFVETFGGQCHNFIVLQISKFTMHHK